MPPTSCFQVPEGLWPALVGRQGLKLSSRTALPSSLQQEGQWNSQSKGLALTCGYS